MHAAALPLPAHPHDPALHDALAELLQLGLAVARLAARLAEVENTALDALAETAAAAAQALATPPASLDAARRAGHDADLSEAARATAVTRVATITECFERAARAVRRTVALTARLEAGRPFKPIPPPGQTRPALSRPASDPRPASRPASDAEHPDRPETGNELGARTDEEIIQAIHRDLSDVAPNVDRRSQETGMVGFSPPSLSPARPGAVLPAGRPPWPHPPPAPDP